jgi:hypothetical protein
MAVSEQKYHAFWIENSERVIRRLSTYDDAQILSLRKKADGEYPSVSQLTVVYGYELEFEPVQIVDVYRIKE